MLGPYVHQSSRRCLVGEGDPAPFDLPSQVRADTPPCFVWSTMADDHVPVENSLEFAQALRRCGVPCELHLYTEGRHGLGLGTVEAVEAHPHLASWAPLCKQWPLPARGPGQHWWSVPAFWAGCSPPAMSTRFWARWPPVQCTARSSPCWALPA